MVRFLRLVVVEARVRVLAGSCAYMLTPPPIKVSMAKYFFNISVGTIT